MRKEQNGDNARTGNGNDNKGERRQTSQPGAPNKSNRQTGGSKRHERDDSSRGADRNTTKKGANSI